LQYLWPETLVALYGIDPAAVTERLAKDGVSVAQVLAKDLSPAEYLEQSFANKIEAEDILHDWQDFSRAYLTASAGGLGADYLIISSWVPS